MVNEVFFSNKLKCNVRQIGKHTARRLWDEGETIYGMVAWMRARTGSLFRDTRSTEYAATMPHTTATNIADGIFTSL